MYVIGVSKYNFIKVIGKTVFNGKDTNIMIRCVNYNTDLGEATVIKNYDKAVELIKGIQNMVDNIKFTNSDVVRSMLENDKDFDKVVYANRLKVYELSVNEVQEV